MQKQRDTRARSTHDDTQQIAYLRAQIAGARTRERARARAHARETGPHVHAASGNYAAALGCKQCGGHTLMLLMGSQISFNDSMKSPLSQLSVR